jgi:hypothetical protein
LITPPNFGSGAGSCLPLMVVVALGEPGTPVISAAITGVPASINDAACSSAAAVYRFRLVIFELLLIACNPADTLR